MTNGEKIQTILDIDKDCTEVYGKNGMMTFSVPQDWWEAEYKEPITENCIACKYDETEEEDGEHCKKCLEGDSQFELDTEFVESTTKNDIADEYISRKDLMVILSDYYDTTVEYRLMLKEIAALPSVTPQLSSGLDKNSKKLDGESDCISRADAIRVASGYCHPSNVAKELAKLPSMGRYDPYTDKFIKE